MNERHEEKYTIPIVKHPINHTILDGISMSGTDALHFLPPKTTMNGSSYLNLLPDKLKTHMDDYECSIYMHYATPSHRSRTVTGYHNAK